MIPLPSRKHRELAASAPLIVTSLHTISGLGESSFEKSLSSFLPLLTTLICVFAHDGQVDTALPLFNKMKSSSIDTDYCLYNVCIDCFVKVGEADMD